MADFITRRKQEWDELAGLVRKGAGRWAGVRRMSPQELHRLDVLYRRAAVDLAQVSTRTRDPHLLQYLNNLVAAAHSIIYLPVRRSLTGRIWSFLFTDFACCVARNGRYHLLSLLLLLLGAFGGYQASMSDPAAAYALMPETETRQFGSGSEELLANLRHGRDKSGEEKTMFAGFLFSNNFRVGVLALALGFFAAVPTVLLIIYNGMIIGAFVAVHHASGIYTEMWAWILPHGITEMGAIVLCGGIGLALGRAVVCPGRYSRWQSLYLAGQEGFLTAMGAGVMLFIAALIESFLRQSHMSDPHRLWFAGISGLCWVAYFLRGYYIEWRKERGRAGV